jgi:hypothetical protein
MDYGLYGSEKVPFLVIDEIPYVCCQQSSFHVASLARLARIERSQVNGKFECDRINGFKTN